MDTARKNVAVLAACLGIIFLAMMVTSFGSGVLIDAKGWQVLNWLALPFITAAAAAVSWLLARRRLAPA